MRLFSGNMLLANFVMFLFVHAWKQKSYVAFFGSLPAFKYVYPHWNTEHQLL